MKKSAHITLVDGVETSALSIADRGLAYGDGLFETMRLNRGEIPLLAYHRERFAKGVQRLGMGDVEELLKGFDKQVAQLTKLNSRSANLPAALIKVILTRGTGGRGYAPLEQPSCSFVSQVFELPEYPQSFYNEGVAVKVCSHRLSSQPLLAGLKHLNRLDQVMASSELGDTYSEGITLSQEGLVVEGTKTNILIFEGNKLITPVLTSCGVEGSLRCYLIENFGELPISEEEVTLDRLFKAEGIALINSVIGIWPVNRVDGQGFSLPANLDIVRAFLKTKLDY